MNSFKKSLNATAKQLKETRVANFCKNAESSANIIVQKLEQEIRTLEDQRERLLDIGSDSTLSLGKNLATTDTDELMKDVFNLGYEIREKTRLLNSLKEDYAILFEEGDKA